MKIIVVEKQFAFVAYFENNPSNLGRGKTSDKAIIDLLNHTPGFSIEIRNHS
ncbi:MAG: hypothetical protein ACM3KM_04445 [Acidobacteriaceae bacterium]